MALTRSSYQPELNLWASILELAIIDFTSKIYDERESARAWIFSDDTMRATSFDSVCSVLNVNPDRLKKLLLDDPMAIRFRMAGKAKQNAILRQENGI